jgi:NAD(P)-dependent dehydrogenase (short-subunit alcohol dehydrogenase family)
MGRVGPQGGAGDGRGLGVGRAQATLLAREGARVVATDVNAAGG